MSNEQKELAGKKFLEVESLIFHTVNKFISHYGGDYDELLSIAYAGYLSAFRRFDKNGGSSFPTWVRYEVWTCMFNEFIKHQNNRNRHQDYMIDRSEQLSQIIRPFIDFIDELSEDALEVVGRVLNVPADLYESIAQSGGNNKKVKKVVINYLRDTGWSRSRVLKSFSNIQEALR